MRATVERTKDNLSILEKRVEWVIRCFMKRDCHHIPATGRAEKKSIGALGAILKGPCELGIPLEHQIANGTKTLRASGIRNRIFHFNKLHLPF